MMTTYSQSIRNNPQGSEWIQNEQSTYLIVVMHLPAAGGVFPDACVSSAGWIEGIEGEEGIEGIEGIEGYRVLASLRFLKLVVMLLPFTLHLELIEKKNPENGWGSGISS